MYHRSDALAVPAGTAPPTHLPGEFHGRVVVFDIIDGEVPGYIVYLMSSYLLTECTDYLRKLQRLGVSTLVPETGYW